MTRQFLSYYFYIEYHDNMLYNIIYFTLISLLIYTYIIYTTFLYYIINHTNIVAYTNGIVDSARAYHTNGCRFHFHSFLITYRPIYINTVCIIRCPADNQINLFDIVCFMQTCIVILYRPMVFFYSVIVLNLVTLKSKIKFLKVLQKYKLYNLF